MTKVNDIFQEELKTRRKQSIFAPTEKCDDADLLEADWRDKMHHHTSISIDETNEEALLNEEYGPRQVESLLGLVLDPLDEKNLADAADDVLAIHHLNQLRNPRG